MEYNGAYLSVLDLIHDFEHKDCYENLKRALEDMRYDMTKLAQELKLRKTHVMGQFTRYGQSNKRYSEKEINKQITGLLIPGVTSNFYYTDNRRNRNHIISAISRNYIFDASNYGTKIIPRGVTLHGNGTYDAGSNCDDCKTIVFPKHKIAFNNKELPISCTIEKKTVHRNQYFIYNFNDILIKMCITQELPLNVHYNKHSLILTFGTTTGPSINFIDRKILEFLAIVSRRRKP